MGYGSNNQQPGAYGQAGSLDPTTAALVQRASTPYQGNARGGGAASAASQLSAALLAAQRLRAQKNRLGVQTYNNPAMMPGQVSTPGSAMAVTPPGTPATLPAQSATMQVDPMQGMGTYA